MGMGSIAPFEVSDQVTLVDLTEPLHVAQANVVEPVTADGFVVRGFHARDETPVPYQVKRTLIIVVRVCTKRKPRLGGVGCR